MSQKETNAMEKAATPASEEGEEHFQPKGAVAITVKSADLRVTSRRDRAAEKKIIWDINDLSKFLEMEGKEMIKSGAPFNLGEEIGVAATWNFFFQPVCGWGAPGIAGYLSLLSVKSSPENGVALGYSIAITSGGKSVFEQPLKRDFLSVGESLKSEQIFTSFILEQTSRTDSMEVLLKLKIYSNEGFKPAVQEGVNIPNLSLQRTMMAEQHCLGFAKLLQSEDGADVDITARKYNEARRDIIAAEVTKKAHKLILTANSTVFTKMFAKGSTAVEAQTGEVVIEDMSQKGLDIFLHFIYTGEILDEWLTVPGEILNAANKFGLKKLKQYCGHHLISVVTIYNAWAMYKVANCCNLSFAKSAISEFISKNALAILNKSNSE